MRLLLDSHIVLWLTTDVPGRSSGALDALVDEANDTLVSAVSVWELEIKRVKGQLNAPADLLNQLEMPASASSVSRPTTRSTPHGFRRTTATPSTACSSHRRRARRRRASRLTRRSPPTTSR